MLPSYIEVFYADQVSDACPTSGWYWWYCEPGCLPDGEACGPFESCGEAERDAETVMGV